MNERHLSLKKNEYFIVRHYTVQDKTGDLHIFSSWREQVKIMNAQSFCWKLKQSTAFLMYVLSGFIWAFLLFCASSFVTASATLKHCPYKRRKNREITNERRKAKSRDWSFFSVAGYRSLARKWIENISQSGCQSCKTLHFITRCSLRILKLPSSEEFIKSSLQ